MKVNAHSRGRAYFELMLLNDEDYDYSYEVPPFKVLVKNSYPPIYMPRVEVEDVGLISRLREACFKLREEMKIDFYEIKFRSIFNHLREQAKDVLLNDGDQDLLKYMDLIVFEVMGISRLAPFLLDPWIEEFFIDGWNSNVYLTHSSFGRMDSDIYLSREEISALMTHIQVYGGKDVSENRLNLKTEIEHERFHVRVNLDSEPLAVDGPNISIRNLRKKYYTLMELIRNGTITIEAAAFLLLAAWTKQNITIIGETGSGKTTLLNSIDLALPRHWRKIYVEDVVESLCQKELNRHQARFRVETLPRGGLMERSKLIQSLLSLHRSPDYFILGEILTEEHSKALFNALASGLRGIETFHSGSVEQALRRWVIHHNIPEICLKDLNVLVLMRKHEGLKVIRRVDSIHELKQGSTEPRGIFKLNSEGVLELKTSLIETDTFKRASKAINMNLKEVFEIYAEIIDGLNKYINIKDVQEASKAFEEIYREVMVSRWLEKN